MIVCCLRTRRSQVRVLQGAPTFTESFRKSRIGVSLPNRHTLSVALIVRVAGASGKRVAAVGWLDQRQQDAWRT